MDVYGRITRVGVVSFRLPDEDETALRRAGIVPGSLAKELVERELRHLRVAHARALSEKYRRKPPKPVAQIVREIRDEH